MLNLALIKKFCETRPGGLRRLAGEAGMSESNLHKCIKKNSMDASNLELVAIALGQPVSVFFNESSEEVVRMPSCSNTTSGDNSPINTGAGGVSVSTEAPADLSLTRSTLGKTYGNPRFELLREKVRSLEREVSDLRSTIKDKNAIIDLLISRQGKE